MPQHYCPDCQSVCECPALDIVACEHVCGQEEPELADPEPPLLLKLKTHWDWPEMRGEREGWPC